VQEIGRRIADITVDSRETTFLFQRLSVALQRGNAVSYLGTFPSDQLQSTLCLVFFPWELSTEGLKIIIIIKFV